jgi:uncharacterized coiled-coil protein SlyX
MAELEQRVQQLESELRELQAMLKTDREQIDHLTNRMDQVLPESPASHGPSAEDIQRAFGGRVFGVIGHLGKYGGSGGAPGALRSLSLRFTVQGEHVEVETATDDPPERRLLPDFTSRMLWSGSHFGRWCRRAGRSPGRGCP